MNTEAGFVLEGLKSKMATVLDETKLNKTAIAENPSGLSDVNDRASVQEIVNSRKLTLDRLEKMSKAIEYLTGLLKKGWQMECTRCEKCRLSEHRIVEHLTSLCVDCKTELEAKEGYKKGAGFFYQ